MTAAILLPTWRKDGDWTDLHLAVHSLAAYAPSTPLHVGWDGPTAPTLDHPAITIHHRPPGLSSAEAFWWLSDQTDADHVIMWSDDCIATPDSIPKLLEDANAHRDRLGLLGPRSNYAAGAQNIREPNDGNYNGTDWTTENTVLEVDFIAPFVALIPRDALAVAGPPPPFESFGDNVICDRLRRAGLRLLVSRAYVHHVGTRSLHAAGLNLSDRTHAGRQGLTDLGYDEHAPCIDGSHPRPA